MIIKILGSGCKKCVTLGENAKMALLTADITGEVEKITDIVAIASYGIMSTPGLVIDGKVVSTGRVLSPSEIVALIKSS